MLTLSATLYQSGLYDEWLEATLNEELIATSLDLSKRHLKDWEREGKDSLVCWYKNVSVWAELSSKHYVWWTPALTVTC